MILEALDPGLHELAPESGRRDLAGLVVVVGDETAGDPVALEGAEVVGTEAGGAVGGGDVCEPRAEEAERVDEGLAEDHLAGRQTVLVPDALVGAGQVEVEGRPRAQVVCDLSPVELGDGAVC